MLRNLSFQNQRFKIEDEKPTQQKESTEVSTAVRKSEPPSKKVETKAIRGYSFIGTIQSNYNGADIPECQVYHESHIAATPMLFTTTKDN
ncbi:hypothetical protein Bhyg_12738 [Pseudolycoriella hygida]|uniref:Uncharacterized protein n=1 Tax=Pseudolycoriella hygida TaxID=35572 RepID=A0A9Q0RZL9_9DIPT|nr:hypothetical protein Bhyg_12738 [Pseudolycoriella hygida]